MRRGTLCKRFGVCDDIKENFTMNDTNQTGGKKFIICVFGESSSGKTTLLRGLISDVILNSRYSVCDAEGFQSKDRRMVAWYRTGKSRQGIVSIGTPGDSWDIIKANIDFFNRNLPLWNRWFKNKTLNGGKRCKKKGEVEDEKRDRFYECPEAGSIPAILVTSARMPLHEYPKWGRIGCRYEILNIPMDVEGWYLQKPVEETNGRKDVDWMVPIRLTAESVLDNIRYILINKKTRAYPNKSTRVVDFKRIECSVSRD